jgi:hypothetical protein
VPHKPFHREPATPRLLDTRSCNDLVPARNRTFSRRARRRTAISFDSSVSRLPRVHSFQRQSPQLASSDCVQGSRSEAANSVISSARKAARRNLSLDPVSPTALRRKPREFRQRFSNLRRSFRILVENRTLSRGVSSRSSGAGYSIGPVFASRQLDRGDDDLLRASIGTCDTAFAHFPLAFRKIRFNGTAILESRGRTACSVRDSCFAIVERRSPDCANARRCAVNRHPA